MSACARCGLKKGTALEAVGGQACASGDMSSLGDDGESDLDCRDRQISAQAALLRSVTGKLEEARELLDGPTEARTMFAAAALIDSVLEALS